MDIATIYAGAKNAAKVLKEAGKIDEYQKILDLMDDSLEKREIIASLTNENNELKEKLSVKDNYYFKNNCYWEKETNYGPFCPRCYDKNKNLLRMIPTYIGSNNANCPECKTLVNYTGIEEDSCFVGRAIPNLDPYA